MKKIVFLTGTRADFGKLKSLIEIVNASNSFEVFIIATGMHLQKKYGYTVDEIQKCGYQNIFSFDNHTSETSMDKTLAKTINGFSDFINTIQPNLIIIHGDRVEALAGAIVGALNNILVAHIEGGEVSGTIDELIRHAVSKMSHIHFVSNEIAKKRLIQMGEIDQSIYVIGSPDVDAMMSNHLPTLQSAKEHYELTFEEYGIAMFHPVTTEYDAMREHSIEFVNALLKSQRKYIVIFPNNDLGTDYILDAYKKLDGNLNFKIFPSIRFEYFLVLLKNASFIIGNSSAGIREAPYYGIPTINIGTRQNNRALSNSIINCGYLTQQIMDAIGLISDKKNKPTEMFGNGNSFELFYNSISQDNFWAIKKQKQFKDIIFNA